MKYILISLIFLFLVFSNRVYGWQSYNYDSMNYGISKGIGYFDSHNIGVMENNSSGMSYQPLIADLDKDDNKEIVIFANNSIKLFDKNLNLMFENEIGRLNGQFDIADYDNDGISELIAVVKNNSRDYYVVLSYNGSDIFTKQKVDVTSQNGSQSIKCIDFDGDGIVDCLFKDYKGVLHSYNSKSENDNLNLDLMNGFDDKKTFPVFADFDNDNDIDLLTEHNNVIYVVDKYRNVKSFNLSMFLNGHFNQAYWVYTLGCADGNHYLRFANLSGNNLEIIWLGSCSLTSLDPSLTRPESYLVAINPDMSIRFNKSCSWMTNWVDYAWKFGYHACRFAEPLIFDYDNDGYDEIGIMHEYNDGIIEPTSFDGYGKIKYLGLGIDYIDGNGSLVRRYKSAGCNPDYYGRYKGCMDYSGASFADMDDDGILDWITPYGIFSLNGSLIYNYSVLDTQAPVPVDIDDDNGLDLVYTRENGIKVFRDNITRYFELSVSKEDISFYNYDMKNNLINVSVNIHNYGNALLENVKIMLINKNTAENQTKIINIHNGNYKKIDFMMGAANNDVFLVLVDPYDEVNETKDNNFAEREFKGIVYLNVDVCCGLNSVFIDYLKSKLSEYEVTDNPELSDVLIYVGKNNFKDEFNVFTISNFNYGIRLGDIFYKDKMSIYPYTALISDFEFKERRHIFLFGNEIDGTITAVRNFNLDNYEEVYFDEESLEGIKVFDFLHNGENNRDYLKDNEQFRKIVKKALEGELFTAHDKNVTTSNNVTLRMRNLKSNLSSNYLLYLNSTGVPVEIPVVMARGIHSNLTTWETLARELANEGRDTWLIEITGGPGQDCDTCPNYNFDDLTDNYWPALINGVLNFTGKDKLQYVGHSNGGRVAIESLANGMINPNKIDTLIGVGVPSAFEGYSTFGYYFGKYGGQIMEELGNKGHVSMTEIGERLRRKCLSNFDIGCTILTTGLKSDNKMSFNVDKQYYLWIINTSDEQIGKDLQLDNFYLVQGWITDDKQNNITHDFIVTEQDEKAIYKNIISANKKHYKVWGAHTAGWNKASLPDRGLTKNIIKDTLNKKALSKYKSNEINST